MQERGATEAEVRETLEMGERFDAKAGRLTFQRTFVFEADWQGKMYHAKQVRAVVVEEPDRTVVLTVIVSYIGRQE